MDATPRMPSGLPPMPEELFDDRHEHQIEIDAGELPMDATMELSLQEVFDRCTYRELRGVQCDCRQGQIILSGTVPTYYLKQLAQSLALATLPDARITNCIDVRWG